MPLNVMVRSLPAVIGEGPTLIVALEAAAFTVMLLLVAVLVLELFRKSRTL